MEADEEESKKLRSQIGSETKEASRKMSMILENQKEEFLNSKTKRREEMEAIYGPILAQIPEFLNPERQIEIEKVVKEIAAIVPRILI